MKEIDDTKLTRVEVINHATNELIKGRLLTLYKNVYFENVELSVQDDGKTLKIFLD